MDILEVTNSHDAPVYLLGAASLCVSYSLKQLLDTVLYYSEIDIDVPGFKKVELDVDYVFQRIGNTYVMQWIDVCCYALKNDDIDLFTDAILCRKVVSGNAICKRYSAIYGINVTVNVNKRIDNIQGSNIARFMYMNHMSYDKFLDSVNGLCEKLECRPDNLDEALSKLL